MTINWFPGHMAVATREIRKAMPTVDFILEVLDARLPFSSENPLLHMLRGEKPHIKVLNKSDLADPDVTAAWVRRLEQTPGVRAFPHTMTDPEVAKRLLSLGSTMLPADRYAGNPATVMILGVPNVGKSTLINTLAGRNIAETSNKPAVTKRQQRIPLGRSYVLLDTPGFLWHKLTPAECGYRLAVSGAIADTAIEYQDIGPFAIRFLRDAYPQALIDRYGLAALPEDDVDILNAIAARRGCVRAGGVVDVQRVCEVVIQDLRRGSFGRISLERPQIEASVLGG